MCAPRRSATGAALFALIAGNLGRLCTDYPPRARGRPRRARGARSRRLRWGVAVGDEEERPRKAGSHRRRAAGGAAKAGRARRRGRRRCGRPVEGAQITASSARRRPRFAAPASGPRPRRRRACSARPARAAVAAPPRGRRKRANAALDPGAPSETASNAASARRIGASGEVAVELERRVPSARARLAPAPPRPRRDALDGLVGDARARGGGRGRVARGRELGLDDRERPQRGLLGAQSTADVSASRSALATSIDGLWFSSGRSARARR